MLEFIFMVAFLCQKKTKKITTTTSKSILKICLHAACFEFMALDAIKNLKIRNKKIKN